MTINEKEIQNYIWENKNNLHRLYCNESFPEIIQKEKPWEITPAEIIFNISIEHYKRMWRSVKNIRLLGCEVQLKKENDSTIRADFLGTFDGENGIAVIELKKSAQAERQAFTELLGYGSHIKTIFSPMSKVDIFYILIAPMEERIVREAVLNSVIYDRGQTFAVVPSWKNDDISTLTLTPWIPTFSEINNISSAIFSENNFDLFKITWDALEGDWSPVKDFASPDASMIQKMNTVSAYAAQIMEEKGIHGFVFCSQAFSENRTNTPLSNAIVIVGLNPYKATKNRFISNKNGVPDQVASQYSVESLLITDIIPELENKYYNADDHDHHCFYDLSTSWDNEITGIGFEVVTTMTKSLDDDCINLDHGGFDWENFQESMTEDIMTHKFDIRPTGIIRQLYSEYSRLDYDYIRENGNFKHPCYSSDDNPRYLVDIMNNHYYFRDFIKRLFNSCDDADY